VDKRDQKEADRADTSDEVLRPYSDQAGAATETADSRYGQSLKDETARCHHDVIGGCLLCHREIERLVEQGMSRKWACAEVLGHSQQMNHAKRHRGDPRR
jgi:hypothetical protein